MAANSSEKYIPLGEAVERFPYPMTYATLRRLVLAGEILAIKPGKEWFVSESELSKFIEKATQPVAGGC